MFNFNKFAVRFCIKQLINWQFGLLFVNYRDIALDDIDTGLVIHIARIEAYIIVSGILPVPACVMLIIVAPVLIGLFDKFKSILFVSAVSVYDISHSSLLIAEDKQLDDIVIVLEHEISASADDNGRLFICKLFDYLCLEIEQVGIAREILA